MWINIVAIVIVLYAIYAGFHVYSGMTKNCPLEWIFLTITPIRELHTISMIDRAFNESFMQPNANDNPMPGLTALAGWGMAGVAKTFVSLDACLLINSIDGLT